MGLLRRLRTPKYSPAQPRNPPAHMTWPWDMGHGLGDALAALLRPGYVLRRQEGVWPSDPTR
jgi:hypothetical protein